MMNITLKINALIYSVMHGFEEAPASHFGVGKVRRLLKVQQKMLP